MRNSSGLLACTMASLMLGNSFAGNQADSGAVVAAQLKNIPGYFEDAAWNQAEVYEFKYNAAPAPIKNRTTVRLGYDSSNLYIGVKCYESNMDKLAVNSKTNDSADAESWKDDFVVISINPLIELKENQYLNTGEEEGIRLAVNPDGAMNDSYGMEKQYNIQGNVKAKKGRDSWEVIIAVNYKSFSEANRISRTKVWDNFAFPVSGDRWYLKICRFCPGKKNESEEKTALFDLPASGYTGALFRSKAVFGSLIFDSIAKRSHNEMVKMRQDLEVIEKRFNVVKKTSPQFPAGGIPAEILESKNNLNAPADSLDEDDADCQISASIRKEESRIGKLKIAINNLQAAQANMKDLDLNDFPPFGYKIFSLYKRVFKDKPCAGGGSSKVAVCLARGEQEFFQVAILPYRNLENLEIEVKLPGLSEYIAVYKVAYADISRFDYSKAVGSVNFPDPILPYVLPESISANENLPLLFKIKVPVDIRAGNYTGIILVKSAHNKPVEIPLTVTVWNFEISQNPMTALPYSDVCMSLGLYTGFIRKDMGREPNDIFSGLNVYDKDKYLRAVRDLCRDLIDHKITVTRMKCIGVAPWFKTDCKDGTWECDASLFEETVRAVLAENIKMIMLTGIIYSETPGDHCVLRKLSEVITRNHWENIFWYKISDEPNKNAKEKFTKLAMMAKKYNLKITTTINQDETIEFLDPLLDAWSPSRYIRGNRSNEKHFDGLKKRNIPVWVYYNHMTYQHPLHGARREFWRMNLWDTQMYSYFAHNLWVANENTGNPWDNMGCYAGLAEAFMVYPPREYKGFYDGYSMAGQPFYLVSSLRYEAITDGIEDYEYIRLLKKSVADLAKEGKTRLAEEGREIIEKWNAYFGQKNELIIPSDKFEEARFEIGNFINKITALIASPPDDGSAKRELRPGKTK